MIADDFLSGTGRRILTAQRSVPVISEGLMLAAAASFARQSPRAGPPATLLAAALATPLPRTRSPPPTIAALAVLPWSIWKNRMSSTFSFLIPSFFYATNKASKTKKLFS